MTRRLLILSIVFIVGLSSVASADQIYVSNKAFKGRVFGVGSEIRLALPDLAKALNYRVEHNDVGWMLSGRPISVTEESQVVWVRLEDLPKDLVRVVLNKDFRTIDLYRVMDDGPLEAAWGGEGTLLVFGTSWCPATKSMKSVLSNLESSNVVHVVDIDIEAPKSMNFRDYIGYFEGNKVPFFVLLDNTGNPLHSFFGAVTYQELMATLQKYLGSFSGN